MWPDFWGRLDVKMPIKIRLQHTQFSHWGRFSGYLRYVSYLDSKQFETEVCAAPDIEDVGYLPEGGDLIRPWLKGWLPRRTGMPWYKVPDFCAEVAARQAVANCNVDIVHFLDGEHCGAFLPQSIGQQGLKACRTIATFHQPPDLLSELIDPNLLQWLDAIVLMSPSQSAFFQDYVAPECTHVLLHGIDADFFHPRANERNPGPVRCVTSGHWLRDWESFPIVAAALPGIAFDVVSSRSEELAALSNVRIHSGLSDDDLAELYRQADILFMPLLESNGKQWASGGNSKWITGRDN